MIGKKITLARKKRGWNQKKLAKMLRVTPEAVSFWESGTRKPNGINMLRLVRVLGLKIRC